MEGLTCAKQLILQCLNRQPKEHLAYISLICQDVFLRSIEPLRPDKAWRKRSSFKASMAFSLRSRPILTPDRIKVCGFENL